MPWLEKVSRYFKQSSFQAGEYIPIDVVHAERLDAVLPQELLLAAVDIPQTNVHQLAGADDVLVLEPPKDIPLVFPGQPGQEGHRHAVDVPAGAHLGNIDVSVGIDPDDGHLTAQTLANCAGSTGDSADGDGVVAAEGEHELALFGVVVDLRTETLRHGADSARLLHASVVGVLGGDIVLVVVDCVVVVDLVVEVFVQVLEQTGLDQRHGGSLDALLHLLKCVLAFVPQVIPDLCITCPPLNPTATTPSWLG